MAKKVYSGISLEQCLSIASKELALPAAELQYKILEEKKGLFKKSVTISVSYEEQIVLDEKDGTIECCEGKLIVRNPSDGGKAAVIVPASDMKLFLNGEEIKTRHEIREEDKVELLCGEEEAKRYMNIDVTTDKLQALLNISYKPAVINGIKDADKVNYLVLQVEKKEEKYPPIFTVSEIKEELNKIGIKYGIIEENLMKCGEKRGADNLLVAQGTAAVDDIDDKLELKFEANQNPKGFLEDERGRVDYKNVGAVSAVKKGDIIALRRPGKSGTDGRDIFGNTIRKKEAKKINLLTGGGCILKDENTVAAAQDGKPCIKNSVFYVYSVHELDGDVNIETGNIDFIGDIKIHGNVLEGMRVQAGNAIEIEKSVENSKILAKGDITIKGNAIMSEITAGGEDVVVLRHLTELKEMKAAITSMVETILEVKKFNLLGQRTSDGEMIKVLIENKFKTIPKLCIGIIRDSAIINRGEPDEVVEFVREKLIGMAPLGIRHFSELDDIASAIDRECETLEKELSLPVTVRLAYCQDSAVTSSGDIYITGKGMYVSRLISHKGIYFGDPRSVARGGELTARCEMKCGIVGSTGGVSTKLAVEENGQIWIDTAYTNTALTIRGKEFILEAPSRNIHAYLDEKGELIVERLKL